jgi:hypothetical protein
MVALTRFLLFYTAVLALPAIALADPPTRGESVWKDPETPSRDVRDLARARNSVDVKQQLGLLRSSHWQVSAFETAPMERYRAPLVVGGPETTWTRISLGAERKDPTGKTIGRATVFVGWGGQGKPEIAVEPDGPESRAMLETDIEQASATGALAAPQSCSARRQSCSSRACCKGYKCKYWGSSLTCDCEERPWTCSFVSKLGAGHPLCTTTPLWAYYKKTSISGCQHATSLHANACGRGIICPGNPYASLTLTYCGQKPGCRL